MRRLRPRTDGCFCTDCQQGAILVELAAASLLLLLIALGGFAASDVTQHQLKIAQTARHIAKYTLRSCDETIQAAPHKTETCLQQAARQAHSQVEEVFPQAKIIVSTYGHNGAAAQLVAIAQAHSEGSQLARTASRYSDEQAWQAFSPLLVHSGYVTVVELFVPDQSLAGPFRLWFAGNGQLRYEVVVF